MRVVFVIESTPGWRVSSRGSKRLATLLGVDDLDRFAIIGLVDHYPGRTSRGEDFPTGLARQNATALLRSVPRGTSLILVGRHVANAFGLNTAVFFAWHFIYPDRDPKHAQRVVVIPDPSASNRWWNEPVNATKAARFLRRIGKEAE